MDETVKNEFEHLNKRLEEMQTESRDYRAKTNEILVDLKRTMDRQADIREELEDLHKKFEAMDARFWKLIVIMGAISASVGVAIDKILAIL